jgi:hypothetical protein
VRHGEALPRGQTLVGRKVFAQGLLEFKRACVLAFNAVGVVRVHAAQQHAQFGGHGLAGQMRASACQVVRFDQQRLLSCRARQKWLELMSCVVHCARFCQHHDAYKSLMQIGYV